MDGTRTALGPAVGLLDSLDAERARLAVDVESDGLLKKRNYSSAFVLPNIGIGPTTGAAQRAALEMTRMTCGLW